MKYIVNQLTATLCQTVPCGFSRSSLFLGKDKHKRKKKRKERPGYLSLHCTHKKKKIQSQVEGHPGFLETHESIHFLHKTNKFHVMIL